MLGCDSIALTGQLHPVRACNDALVAARTDGITTSNHTILPANSAAGRDKGHRIGRVRVKRVANHHTSLGEVVGVLYAEHLCNYLAIAGQLLPDVAELVSGAPDIGACGVYRIGARRGLHECWRIASEPQRQCINTSYSPILPGQRQGRL